MHCRVARLQASDVHALPSLQSADAAQQPGMGVWRQVPVPVSQPSVVHALPSSQSAAVLQQPGSPADVHAVVALVLQIRRVFYPLVR